MISRNNSSSRERNSCIESRYCRWKRFGIYFVLAGILVFRLATKPNDLLQLKSADSSNSVTTTAVKNDSNETFLSTPPALTSNGTSSSSSSSSSFEFTYFSDKPECTPLQPDQVSVTLTTQLSMDRIWIMKHQCERWPSPLPISIAIFLSGAATQESVLQMLETTFACDLSRMQVSFLQDGKDGITMADYPFNPLRNLAFGAVTTTHAVYIDSDFLISEGLHQHVLESIKHVADDPKAAIVVPVFEYQSTNCSADKIDAQEEIVSCLEGQWAIIPKTKQDLMPLLANVHRPKAKWGYQDTNGKNRYHSTTMYRKWMENQTTILPIPCLKSKSYEPYLVVRLCNQLPNFPDVFRGYGWDKVIWTLILVHKFGYSLWQIPYGFALHLPHATSKARELDFERKADQKPTPPEKEAYLKWFWSNPDHPKKLPTCQDYKQQLKRQQSE